MTTIIKSNLIYSSSLHDLEVLLKNFLAEKEYKFIYVSIGAKWNEYSYEYSDKHGTAYIRKTNSHLQMIPNFIQDREDNVLLLCMDDFQDINNRIYNIDIIQKQLTDNIDFIFYDGNKIKEFMDLLLQNIKIPPNRFMIVNYIRFRMPNTLESSLEDSIPDIIYDFLLPTIYKNSFYQWFGYQTNLYNIIYNYNNYRQMFNFIEVIRVLSMILNNSMISFYNIKDIYEYYKKQTHYRYLETFLKNTVDISSFDRKDEKVYCSLMEILET